MNQKKPSTEQVEPPKPTKDPKPEEPTRILKKSPICDRFVLEDLFDDDVDHFKYPPQSGDGTIRVASHFNDCDDQDLYEEVTPEDIVDGEGEVQKRLTLGKSVYVKARKKGTADRIKQPEVEEPEESLKTPGTQTFAILINNDSNEERHRKNIHRAYHTLRSRGIDPCNLYVVSDPNQNTECQDSRFNVNPDVPSNGIASTFVELEKRMDKDDNLILYVTGHGMNGGIRFNNGLILGYHTLRSFAKSLNPRLTIAISDTCMGGGIVKEFKEFEGRSISLSPTSPTATTSCDYFTPHLWDLMRYNWFDLDGKNGTSVREGFAGALSVYSHVMMERRDLDLENGRTFIQLLKEGLKRKGGEAEFIESIGEGVEGVLFTTTGGVYDATLDGRILQRPRVSDRTERETTPTNGVIEFTGENYRAEVAQSDIPVVVGVYAWWCGPCKLLHEEMQKIAPEYAGRVKFGRIEYWGRDGSPLESKGPEGAPRRNAIRMHTPGITITSYPTVLFVNNGIVARQERGAMEVPELRRAIDSTFFRVN